MKKVVQTPAWDQYLKENNLSPDERWGDAFTQYVKQTEASLKKRLQEFGAL